MPPPPTSCTFLRIPANPSTAAAINAVFPPQNSRCYNCGQADHMARDCPSGGGGGGGRFGGDGGVAATAPATTAARPATSPATAPGRSVNEFVDACKKATGVNIKIEYLNRRPGDYAEVYSDPTKINKELNWTAQYTDLKESLSVAWRWQKSHPRGYGPN